MKKYKKNNAQVVKFYKKKYNIVFYDHTDEVYLYSFDNIIQICEFRGMEVNAVNKNLIGCEICNALRRKNHTTKMLDGRPMRVYLIDMFDDQ